MQLIRVSDIPTHPTIAIPARLFTRTVRIDPDVDEPLPDPEPGDHLTQTSEVAENLRGP